MANREQIMQAIKELTLMYRQAQLDFYPERRNSLLTALNCLEDSLYTCEAKSLTSDSRALKTDIQN